MYWCNRSIKGVSNITSENNSLSLRDNDTTYNIIIPEGDYFTSYNLGTSVLVDEINNQFKINSIPITAEIGGIIGDIQYNDSLEPTDIIENWSNYGGDDWDEVDGKLKMLLNSSTERIIYNPYDFNAVDYKLSATFLADTDDDVFGLAFRYIDSSNYYYVGYQSYDGSGGIGWGYENIRIYKVIDGVRQKVDGVVIDGWDKHTEYKFGIEVVGQIIKVYLNGNLVLETTDDSFSHGTYGFFGTSQIFYCWDMSLEKLLSNENENPRRSIVIFRHNDKSNEVQSINGSLLNVIML